MTDEASPIRSTGFLPVGRPGILPGQSGEETGKMPVGPTAKMAVPQPQREGACRLPSFWGSL
jgi:hypothetical protein